MTIDTKYLLSAVDRASPTLRKVSSEFGNLGGAAKSATGFLRAFGVGLSVAGAIQAVRGFVDTSAAIVRLAELSGTATDEFQRLAAGADTVGISQEKLADIFKDVQDKVGDFLQNGGGPLKDFFDNIAPAVGVTAEQFRKLSGPQALELYVSSLQKANISQSEMTFYMEAIANDATLLLPLLLNNARGFKEAGDEAQRLGYVIDTETLAASEKFRKEMITLGRQLEGAKVSIFGPLISALAEVVTGFNAAQRAGLGFWNSLGTDKSNINDQIEFYEKKLAGIQAQLAKGSRDFYGRPVDTSLLEQQAADAEAQLIKLRNLQLTLTGAGFAPSGLPEPPGSSGGSGRGRAGTGGGGKKTKPYLAADPLFDLIKEKTAEYERLDKLADEAFKQLQDQEAASIRLEEQEIKRLQGVAEEWRNATDVVAKFEQKYEDVMQAVQLGPAKGGMSEEQGALARFLIGNETDGLFATMDQAKVRFDEFTLEAARNIQDTLGQGLYDVLDGNFKSIGDSFGNMLKKMAAEAMAADLGRFLLGDFAKTGKVGGVAGGFFDWLGGLIPSHAMGLDYVPYDGYIARLHKGERVQTAKEARSGGGIVVNLVNNFGGGVDRSQMGAFAKRIQESTAASIREAQLRNDPMAG